ncbi:hypothetical protein E2320_005087 [Naja naja]|nr:hypothetical protein E2320_005087 [Naja naja]
MITLQEQLSKAARTAFVQKTTTVELLRSTKIFTQIPLEPLQAKSKTLPKRNSAEDLRRRRHTINAQEKNNMAYRLLSARDHKIKELKTKWLFSRINWRHPLWKIKQKKLEEREQLQRKLTSLTQKWEASEKRTQPLRKKIIEAQSITENLQVEIKSLKLKLKERERELSITNIYAHRIRSVAAHFTRAQKLHHVMMVVK